MAETGVGHEAEGGGVAAVGLEETGVAFERVRVGGVDGALGVAVSAALDHGREVVGEGGAFGWGEDGGDNCEAVVAVGGDGVGWEVDWRIRIVHLRGGWVGCWSFDRSICRH